MENPADRYDRLATRFTRIVDDVPDERWDESTPCDGWSVRDVVAHVVDTQRDFLARFDFVDDAAPASETTDPAQVRARWQEVRDRAHEVLADPELAGVEYEGYFGPTTVGASLDQFYTDDMLVHGWDVARGAGLPAHEPMPTDDAERVLASLRELPEEALRSDGIYGPPVEVGDDADAQTRLLAFVGREA